MMRRDGGERGEEDAVDGALPLLRLLFRDIRLDQSNLLLDFGFL
jgi:hypothetical protein